jgi:hypothetical protein
MPCTSPRSQLKTPTDLSFLFSFPEMHKTMREHLGILLQHFFISEIGTKRWKACRRVWNVRVSKLPMGWSATQVEEGNFIIRPPPPHLRFEFKLTSGVQHLVLHAHYMLRIIPKPKPTDKSQQPKPTQPHPGSNSNLITTLFDSRPEFQSHSRLPPDSFYSGSSPCTRN